MPVKIAIANRAAPGPAASHLARKETERRPSCSTAKLFEVTEPVSQSVPCRTPNARRPALAAPGRWRTFVLSGSQRRRKAVWAGVFDQKAQDPQHQRQGRTSRSAHLSTNCWPDRA